jgi:hypothetical protein
MDPEQIFPVLLACFIVWRLYTRMRRNIGRQPLRPTLMIIRIVILSLLTIALGVFSLFHPQLLIGLGPGLVLGLPLAWWGLTTTKYETTPQGKFYTPNVYLGIGLTVLLAGRVLYRLLVVMPNMRNASNAGTQQPFMQSRLSLFLFGFWASYFIAYYIGVLLRSRSAAATA